MVPHQVSRYRVLSRLGHGGMGEVFLAEDLSLRRKVALKFLLPSLDDADKRLVREARAAAHLDHPFICKVYEVGEQEGRRFFAMEYVEGTSLKERLAGGRVSQKEAVRIAVEVADALQFAHTRGIVHRDLKPANVMVGTDGHVKVMDFGIAKRLATQVSADAATAEVTTVSLPGEVTGTLAYMSPEQLRNEPVDQRSDVFAFGVLLYELLAGKHPFTRGSAIETATAILNDAPAPLDHTTRGTSPLLEHIVARCLEKDRERRYQSLADVRIELDALGAPSSAAVPAPRNRSRWIAGAILGGAIALGVVHSIHPLPFLAPEPALAFKERDWIVVADFNNLTGDSVFDSSLRLALEVAIAQSQYVNVYPQDRVAATLRRMQRTPSGRLDEGLAAEVAQRDRVRAVLACDIAQLGSHYSITARVLDPQTRVAVLTDSVNASSKDDVLAALDRLAKRVRTGLGESLSLLSAQSRPLPVVTTSSLDALKMYADSLKSGGDSNASLELARQAVVLDPQFALAHAEIGRRYYLEPERDTRELAEKHYQIALGLADRLTVRERLWIQASVEDSRGNREQAVNAFNVYLAQYPDDVSALSRLAWTQMAGLQQHAQAVENFKRVLALYPDNASAHVNLATCYGALGDHASAIASYQKSFELEPEMILAVFVNHEYGFTLVDAGRHTEADAVFARMKTEARPSIRARGFRSTAFLQMYRGKYSAAVAELRQAIALNQTHRSPISEYRDRFILYSALYAMGQPREAALEWPPIARLIQSESLSPEWLWRPVKMMARLGRIDEATRLVGLMGKTVSSTTAASTSNRDMMRDAGFIELARAEIDLARQHTADALGHAERAHFAIDQPDSLETFAVALVRSGRTTDAIARYEELLRKAPFGTEAQELWFRTHLTLAELYERAQRPGDARRLYSTLLTQWKDGDANLPLLRAVRERLAKLPA